MPAEQRPCRNCATMIDTDAYTCTKCGITDPLRPLTPAETGEKKALAQFAVLAAVVIGVIVTFLVLGSGQKGDRTAASPSPTAAPEVNPATLTCAQWLALDEFDQDVNGEELLMRARSTDGITATPSHSLSGQFAAGITRDCEPATSLQVKEIAAALYILSPDWKQ